MVINGKEYTLPKLDYNAICELDKYGVNLLSGEQGSPLTTLRGFLALSLRSKLAAGNELEAHIIENGFESLNEAFEDVSRVIEESHFLSQMREKAEKEEEKEKKRRKAAKTLPDPTGEE